jgi:predicted flap endonuclease-1-like 5' DNA nuclease
MKTCSIIDVEGIGPSYAEKLKGCGVRSVNAFLKSAATRTDRKKLAQESGIEEKLILKWANFADLYRIRGVGRQYSELLEKAGVDTVKELATRVPENLHQKMIEVNSQGKRLVRQVPALVLVKSWVEQAKSLDPMISH